MSKYFECLSLRRYGELNTPLYIGSLILDPPKDPQYILRMLIKRNFSDFAIPQEYEWVRPMIDAAMKNQDEIGIRHPFCYLTIRNGPITSVNDDQWHVDGFSLNFSHLPEQNYIWSSNDPTEFVVQKWYFPLDFNPLKHNIHHFFQDHLPYAKIEQMEPKALYMIDPYIVHRRPPMTEDKMSESRTLVRVSFIPIEVRDINNTPNPLMATDYTEDRVKTFRDKLLRYPEGTSKDKIHESENSSTL